MAVEVKGRELFASSPGWMAQHEREIFWAFHPTRSASGIEGLVQPRMSLWDLAQAVGLSPPALGR
ncbi:hypothetical protein GS597_09170 [Synechococcales cyanobacterium C]|uniref:Uncharacterized protein n=1 Tax=Petrachloros mirabilis ULC683 TaxID=2781853 RepID=A0A8K1ZYZ2_9CYAN|nr:hypothetical protein [Petrachloros mirabilis]NCJ06673.1 hypothetical protein [Petrachloros mirabilis ULC683]